MGEVPGRHVPEPVQIPSDLPSFLAVRKKYLCDPHGRHRYYCNDLTINNGCALIFTGPTVIYFSGNVTFNGDVSMGPASGVRGT
jgi:hypothetical protein